VLQNLIPRQASLSLFLGQLVHMVQLLHQPVLFARRKPPEAGVAAQNTLLLLRRKIPMLIQPVA
jgi:hypothetical protein